VEFVIMEGRSGEKDSLVGLIRKKEAFRGFRVIERAEGIAFLFVESLPKEQFSVPLSEKLLITGKEYPEPSIPPG